MAKTTNCAPKVGKETQAGSPEPLGKILLGYDLPVAKKAEVPKIETPKTFEELVTSCKKFDGAAVLQKKKKDFEENHDRILEKYGEEGVKNLHRILKCERLAAQCAQCDGTKCIYGTNTKWIFNLRDGHLIEYYVPCPHAAAKAAAKAQAELQEKFKLTNIPPEYIGKTFADYTADANNETAIKAAHAIIKNPKLGVYFYGGVGTGKTFLASIVAQELLKAGREVIFATIPTLSMKLRSTFKKNAEITEVDILEKLYKVDTVIIDDVGMEKPTRFVASTLCNLFNERYNARRQTIITSNYSLKILEYIYNNPSEGGETLDGTRIYDRCKQMCRPVCLKGDSRRL